MFGGRPSRRGTLVVASDGETEEFHEQDRQTVEPRPPDRAVGSRPSGRRRTRRRASSDEDGERVAEILQERLVALIDLGLTLKHIHWNVVGPSFVGVHQMLDPQYAGVQAMVDTRRRAGRHDGRRAERASRAASSPTRTWDDYDLGRADTQAHLGALDLVYRNVVADHRQAIEEMSDLDPVSEDILIGQTGELEMYHWFVRSHLADWAGGLVTAGTDDGDRRCPCRSPEDRHVADAQRRQQEQRTHLRQAVADARSGSSRRDRRVSTIRSDARELRHLRQQLARVPRRATM